MMTEEDITIDEIADRIGCEQEQLMWDPLVPNWHEAALWLILPNCRVVEMDPDDAHDVTLAGLAWDHYTGTAATMRAGDKPDAFLAHYIGHARPSVVLGVTSRIRANLSKFGRPERAKAVY